jgi:hypothetical protein
MKPSTQTVKIQSAMQSSTHESCRSCHNPSKQLTKTHSNTSQSANCGDSPTNFSQATIQTESQESHRHTIFISYLIQTFKHYLTSTLSPSHPVSQSFKEPSCPQVRQRASKQAGFYPALLPNTTADILPKNQLTIQRAIQAIKFASRISIRKTIRQKPLKHSVDQTAKLYPILLIIQTFTHSSKLSFRQSLSQTFQSHFQGIFHPSKNPILLSFIHLTEKVVI